MTNSQQTPLPSSSADASWLTIGIMTGNSLDGADLVLTEFNTHSVKDLAEHHISFDQSLYTSIRKLQNLVKKHKGFMEVATQAFETEHNGQSIRFKELVGLITELIAKGVQDLIKKAQSDPDTDHKIKTHGIDVIGFHGQTIDHFPPSVRNMTHASTQEAYTIQIADGQGLADITNICVVHDFRSDDLMNGGEGAPLAPLHHRHLSQNFQANNQLPFLFCNAGNTGNLTLISSSQTHDLQHQTSLCVTGWDTGPFNHYQDQLVRINTQKAFDENGEIGRKGNINLDLLSALYKKSTPLLVGTKPQGNFLELQPPKSSDPNFYQWIDQLQNETISFEDRVRTCEYFSVYVFVLSLRFIDPHLEFPRHFGLCGGGWKNPLVLQDLKNLISTCLTPESRALIPMFATEKTAVILPEHQEIFQNIGQRFSHALQKAAQDHQTKGIRSSLFSIGYTDDIGLSSQSMEARIWADFAKCTLQKQPISEPKTTGVLSPTVGGIIAVPHQSARYLTHNVHNALKQYYPHFLDRIQSVQAPFEQKTQLLWSRASAGWSKNT